MVAELDFTRTTITLRRRKEWFTIARAIQGSGVHGTSVAPAGINQGPLELNNVCAATLTRLLFLNFDRPIRPSASSLIDRGTVSL